MKSNLSFIGQMIKLAFVLALAYSKNLAAHELVMGWEGSSTNGYALLNPVITVQRGEQISWLARASISYLYYDSRDATGVTKVQSPGESLGIAVRYSGNRLSATFGPGYEIRQTRHRFASGLETKTNERGTIYQGDVFFQATPLTNLSVIGSYGQVNKYFWVRGGAKRQISNFDNQGNITIHAGVEATRQGNYDLHTTQIGVVLETAYPRLPAALQFHLGRTESDFADGTRDSGIYLGISSYWAY